MPRCIVLVDATYNAYGMLEMAYCILSLGIKIFKNYFCPNKADDGRTMK